MIKAKSLTKVYKKYSTGDGLVELSKNFFLRRYTEINAVDNVSFEIEKGSCVGLLGANGAGKTTLVKMLVGLLVPSSGSAEVLNFNPQFRAHEYLRKIGVVMGQKQQLWIDVSAFENLRLHQVIYNLDKQEFHNRIYSLAEMLEVKDLLHVQIRKLSLGEKMKMELLAAFLHKPEVLFLDEPTIGLDIVAQNTIRTFIREQVEKNKVTVLLTSHYIKDLEELCKRVLFIQNGKLLHDGSLANLSGSSQTLRRISWEHFDNHKVTYVNGSPILKLSNGRSYIEVESTEVTKYIRFILDQFHVNDLSIEPLPLEELIRQVLIAKSPTKTPLQ